MKILILLSIFTLSNCDTSSWTDLRIKFQLSIDTEDIESFYKIEKTIEDAYESGWITINNPNDLGLSTLCMSEEDVRACALYDRNGLLAGMQLSIPRSDFERNRVPYDIKSVPAFEMKKLGVKTLNEYWTSMFLIVSPSTLINGGRDDIEEFAEGLWLKNGSFYTQVPTDERRLETNTNFRKQNCVPTLGTHYYPEPRSNSCNELHPYYLLVSNGIVHGVGWQVFGRDTNRQRSNAAEDMTRRIVEAAMPNAPNCLGEWTRDYGLVSVQTFFIDQPWNIKCNPLKDSILPITGLRRFLIRSLYATNDIINAITRKIRVYIDLLPGNRLNES